MTPMMFRAEDVLQAYAITSSSMMELLTSLRRTFHEGGREGGMGVEVRARAIRCYTDPIGEKYSQQHLQY